MSGTYNIATLNINGMSTSTKMAMLTDFLHKHAIDIIFLQEVTRPVFDDVRGYTAHVNIGANERGTAILTRDHLTLTDIERLPTGRGMSACLDGITLVNIYAPSGAERRRERDAFFATDLPYLLRRIPQTLLLGGDFNSVLTHLDSTGQPTLCRALSELIRGFDLVDIWEMSTNRPVYTHYTGRGASRIDRIYVSRNLHGKKINAETRVAAFTDHLAVVLRIVLDITTVRRGRSYWKMNTALLQDDHFLQQLRLRWTDWYRRAKYYPTLVMWWERAVKTLIKKFFIYEGTVIRREAIQMENFYYACLYDILRRPSPHEVKRTKLNQLKAKIIKLHNTKLQQGQPELRSPDFIQEERMSLYQMIKRREQRKKRDIVTVHDGDQGEITTATNILRVFSEHIRMKYSPISVDMDCVRQLLENNHGRIPLEGHNILDMPITQEELKAAVHKGNTNKSPGRDGIALEFFTALWDTMGEVMTDMFNQILRDRTLTERQKQGVIVCIPKQPNPKTPEDYRPLTLLNVDYKILARVITARVQPFLSDILHPSQHCGTSKNTIFDALATVRDAIAYAETMQTPLCVVTLDFKQAFDRISHTYLMAVMRNYDFDEGFIECISMMYDNATSVVQINGHLSQPIPIQSGVRQGCPLSMLLFALCINPLLCYLDDHLTGIRVQRSQRKTTVVAYADDVTILVASQADVATIREAINCYEKATGATLNVKKSNALAVGTWDTTNEILGIPYSDQIKILGIQMRNTVQQSALATWDRLSTIVRAQTCRAYSRDLNTAQRIQYTQVYMLAKLWYTAQVLLPPSECMRQITSAITWYIWQGAIFRVPLSTLQKRKKDGGWGLTDVHTKCRTLLISRLWLQGQLTGTLTACWLKYWNIHGLRNNPPDLRRIPPSLDYLRTFVQELAYVDLRMQNENRRPYRRRIYWSLRQIAEAGNPPREMRIVLLHPDANWGQLWVNLTQCWTTEKVRITWYKVIHDIFPTNERLHRINLSVTPLCETCGRLDTIQHRITDCGEGATIWKWTQQRIAWILRTDPCNIPPDWTTQPHYRLWPPQRHRAVTWILAHVVWYMIRERNACTLQDYMDFLQRTRWKAYQHTQRRMKVGNYLTILGPVV
jgi:exonuclease III